MRPRKRQFRILGIDPCTRGFGFAVLEGADRLVDWGVACVWAKSDKEFMARIECLVERYATVFIVLEELVGGTHGERKQRLIGLVEAFARSNRINVSYRSRASARDALKLDAEATKHTIAEALVGVFPELAPHLPPPRRPWMHEDERMNVFDALALAVSKALNISVD